MIHVLDALWIAEQGEMHVLIELLIRRILIYIVSITKQQIIRSEVRFFGRYYLDIA